MESNMVKRYFVGEEKLFDQYIPDWRQQVNNDVRRSNDGLQIIIELNVSERFDAAFNPDLGIKKLALEDTHTYLQEHAAEWDPASVVKSKQPYTCDELTTLNKTTLKEIAVNEFQIEAGDLTKTQLIDAILEAQGA